MKGREVPIFLKRKGFEQGVTEVLVELCERANENDRTFMEFAKTVQGLMTVLEQLTSVNEGMKAQLESIKERLGHDKDN